MGRNMNAIRSTLAIQLLIPFALFGYAAVANFSMPGHLAPVRTPEETSLSFYFNGGATGQLEQLYRDGLPHRQLAVELVGAARYLLLGEGRRGVVVGENGYLFTDEEFRFAGNQEALLATSADRIAEISETLASRNIKLVIVPLPMKSDIYANQLNRPAASALAKDIYDSFRAVLLQRGISAVDTRSALLSARVSGQLFLKTDTHWTPAGAEAVAGAVAAQALGEKSGLFLKSSAADAKIEGDLVKYVTGGPFSQLVGLGTEIVTPVSVSAKAPSAQVNDLFGDATEIPVALVGTSYSANDIWSFAPLLSFKTGLDVANAALVGQGPVRPMRKYLASLTDTAAQPQTVIWEFPVRFLTDKHLWDETTAEKETVGHGSH